jgi:dTDP-4-amino-4,6-dideoxygalactose transaminase
VIAPQRPPFGISRVLISSLLGGDMKRVEEAYAETTGGLHPVWLPSARAGICWALRSAIQPGDKVIGPAFTCGVVHEAMVRAGGRMDLVDAAEDDFLMTPEAIARAQNGRHALVLCELYGHEYDLTVAARKGPGQPVVRIVDMAMTVPQKELFQRLEPKDFGIISFGVGKSMYAGGGAIGFARDAALAEEVKKLRDTQLVGRSYSASLKRATKTWLRTIGHNPMVYSAAKRLRPPGPVTSRPVGVAEKIPTAWMDDGTMSPEWREPGFGLDCGLAEWNLKQADFFHASRMEQARRYHENLNGVAGLVRPKTSKFALSHYTVRVAAGIRERLRQAMFQSGLHTLTLWEFRPYLDSNLFPNAFGRSCEVVNLPLIPGMSPGRVDEVCDILKQCLARLSST